MQQKQGWPRVAARSQGRAMAGRRTRAKGVKVADCIQSLRRAAVEGLSEHVY